MFQCLQSHIFPPFTRTPRNSNCPTPVCLQWQICSYWRYFFGFKSTIRCLSEFFGACFSYFLWWSVIIYTMKFLLCPTAELEIRLHQMPFEIDPFWRWTARNKLQFCHSTCLNENEENQQKTTTCEPSHGHHWCFVNTNYSHSRPSICSFQKSCGYKGWEAVARGGKCPLCHLQLYRSISFLALVKQVLELLCACAGWRGRTQSLKLAGIFEIQNACCNRYRVFAMLC